MISLCFFETSAPPLSSIAALHFVINTHPLLYGGFSSTGIREASESSSWLFECATRKISDNDLYVHGCLLAHLL